MQTIIFDAEKTALSIQLPKMFIKSTIFHKTRKTKEIPRIILLHFTLQTSKKGISKDFSPFDVNEIAK